LKRKGIPVNQIVKKQTLEVIKSAEQQIAERLPSGMDAKKFVLTVGTAVQKNAALLNCTPSSLLLAVYEAAELGINLNPALQLAYIVPYGDTALFQLGYRGMIQKAYQTGDIKSLYAEVVYENDQLQRQLAPKRNLFHAPPDKGERGDPIGAYAFMELKDGTVDWEYLTKEQILRRRKNSKAYQKEGENNLLWGKFWEEAWKKTPIRVLFKRIPLISQNLAEFAEVVARDAEADAEPEPTGKIELEPDTLIPKPLPAPPEINKEPEPAKPIYQENKTPAIRVHVGTETTSFSGDMRGVLSMLPKIGAKMNKATRIWTLPASSTSVLTALLDEKGIPWEGVDESGNQFESEPTKESTESSTFTDEAGSLWPRTNQS